MKNNENKKLIDIPRIFICKFCKRVFPNRYAKGGHTSFVHKKEKNEHHKK